MLFEVKEDIVLSDLQKLHPAIWVVFTSVIIYAKKNKLPLKITSLINDRDNVNAISKTHDTGRAIDISIAGWSKVDCTRLCHKLNTEFSDIAAISYSDRRPRCAIYKHNHIHIQVRPGEKILDKFESI
tara:strand:+ start:2329 stop:2712 length:384 start_codon:yes stop_codon:yes gene_type:complete